MAFKVNKEEQTNFFDEGQFLSDREKSFMKNSWFQIFADNIFPHINEQPYEVIYSKTGRPNTPVNVLIGASILKELFQLSDDDIVETLIFDRRYQHALHTASYNQQPLSDKSLSRFRKRCMRHYLETGVDLIQNTMEELAQDMKKLMNINSNITRMDSMMIAANIRNLSRMELIYTVILNVCKELIKDEVELPEELKHYADKNDFNKVMYHDKETTKEDKLQILLKEVEALIKLCTGKYDESERYKQFSRCIEEQTIVENGVRRLKKKEDKAMNASMMQNPSDPDATYREKAGKSHKGYVANLVEEVGETGSIVTSYQLEQNIYSDAKFLKDYVNKQEKSEKEKILVTDGAYGGEENRKLAKEKNIRLVTTGLTGKPSPDIVKEFKHENQKVIKECPARQVPESSEFQEKQGRIVVFMPSQTCRDCGYRNQCKVRDTKKGSKIFIKQKDIEQADTEKYRQTEEFKNLARVRNGAETIPSNLRNNYNVDKMPRGKVRGKFFFGCKVMALNCKKTINFMNHKSKNASNPIYRALAA